MNNLELMKEGTKILKANGYNYTGEVKKRVNKKIYKKIDRLKYLEKKWENAYECNEYQWLKAERMNVTIKSRAMHDKLGYELDFEWFLNKLRHIGHCEVTGMPFNSVKDKNNNIPYQAIINRIDNTKGYTKKNSRLVVLHYKEIIKENLDMKYLTILNKLAIINNL